MTDATPAAGAILRVTVLGLEIAALLSVTHNLTSERIRANETAELRAALSTLLPPGATLPSPLPTTDSVPGAWPLCGGAFLVQTTAPGYAGPLQLLYTIEPDTIEPDDPDSIEADTLDLDTLAADAPATDSLDSAALDSGSLDSVTLTRTRSRLGRVRLISHQETPGITDFLNDPAWWAALAGSRAAELEALDAVSGATITSRAIGRHLAAVLREPAAILGSAGAETAAGCAP